MSSFVLLLMVAAVGYPQVTTQLDPVSGVDSVPGDDCPNGEIHDDGGQENGYGYVATVTEGIIVDLFTPSSYPWVYDNVCLCMTQNGGDTDIAYDVVIYDDDGAAGAPGTLLATFSDTATGVPTWPSVQFYSSDITSVAPTVSDGSVYIGVTWDPSVDQSFYFCADQSAGTPLNGGWAYNDSDGVWGTIQTWWTSYRAMLFRADGVLVPVELQSFSVE